MIWKIFVPLVALAAFSETRTSEELKFSANGVGLAIHMKSSASRSPLSTTGAVTIEKDSIPYRIVLDRENRPLFAYELELREAGPNFVRVMIRPASQEKLRSLDSFFERQSDRRGSNDRRCSSISTTAIGR
jgi:hypothetical protein